MLPAAPRWFGPPDRPLHGFLHAPEGPARGGVVLCAPIGYEAWCSYRTFRALAERLAADGFLVLRFDYDGTHDSAGHYTEPARVAAWRASVACAIDELAAAGVPRIALVGLRLGATLAWLAADSRVDQLVLWDPIISGKRYVRELKVFAMGGPDPLAADGALAIAGTVHTAETLAELAKLDLATAPVPAARDVVVIERDDRPLGADRVWARLRDAGATASVRARPGTGGILDVAVEHGVVPEAIVDAIASAIADAARAAPAVAVRPAPSPREAAMRWDGAELLELALRTPQRDLFGILTRPVAGDPRVMVALITSGTEHHTGPGRIWVEFARELAGLGYACLRVDLSGVGESPLHGPPRAIRPYDLEHLRDVADIAATGRALGFRQVVVLGLCAGAWMAIHAAIADPALAVIAVNPQLYWQPGEPVDILISESRARRGATWEREERLRKLHVWSALDAVGIRAPAARWLDQLVARRVPTLLAFAERDDGVTYLERRCGRALERALRTPTLSLVEVAGIDHPMHRYAKRPEMMRAFAAFLAGLTAA